MAGRYYNKKGVFDSKEEEKRFYDLMFLQNGGIISELKRQVPFELIPAQRDEDGRVIERSVKYIADFTYIENGELVVEDVKSDYTRKIPEYVLKRKMMLYLKGIRIREVL